MKKKDTDLTIRKAIQRDNTKIICIIIAIVLLATINLGLIDLFQFRENQYRVQLHSIQQVTISQYKWLDNLLTAEVNKDGNVTVEMDPDQCSFAVWYQDVKEAEGQAQAAQMLEAYEAHKKMHDAGSQLIASLTSNSSNQQEELHLEMKAQSAAMLTALENLSTYYTEKADTNHSNLVSRIIWAIVTNIILAVLAGVVAKKLGNKTAVKIAHPISAVADWSRELSMGSSELDFQTEKKEGIDYVEIRRMVESFQAMAANIQENVRVVQKVADGDMTAFVNIRSASDSLGKNLYKMVQSNDIMFAEIAGIATSVADGADSISQASSALASSSSVQADAIKSFTDAIQVTGEFIYENNERTAQAISVSSEIEKEVLVNTKKMKELLQSMGEIRTASEKVSDIIKTIDDIAGQTNLLALNAAIEAARAGEAGKGFAVVAGEVKELASKSAQAADESKKLIQDTVEKSIFGDSVSKETAEAFTKIADRIEQIAKIISSIAETSSHQQVQIDKTKENIAAISDAIDNNAAASQETSASSVELSENANALKESMERFNLRKREQGKPYIPPEKVNDIEFIKKAEEDYQKALKQGKVYNMETN